MLDLKGINGHESIYSKAWLNSKEGFEIPPCKQTNVSYKDVIESDEGLLKLLSSLHTNGFCFVPGCPPTNHGTRMLAERISFIKTTHYGTVWELEANSLHRDSAYTTKSLPLHTDTPYYTEPIGLQLFHMVSHEGGHGGASLYADGWRAARLLKQRDASLFKVLCEEGISYKHHDKDNLYYEPLKEFPIITCLANDTFQIRHNASDWLRLPKTTVFMKALLEWHKALLDCQFKVQLKAGEPIIIDNWRILHGREEFSGKRKIIGAYIGHDDYRAKLAQLCMNK